MKLVHIPGDLPSVKRTLTVNSNQCVSKLKMSATNLQGTSPKHPPAIIFEVALGSCTKTRYHSAREPGTNFQVLFVDSFLPFLILSLVDVCFDPLPYERSDLRCVDRARYLSRALPNEADWPRQKLQEARNPPQLVGCGSGSCRSHWIWPHEIRMVRSMPSTEFIYQMVGHPRTFGEFLSGGDHGVTLALWTH